MDCRYFLMLINQIIFIFGYRSDRTRVAKAIAIGVQEITVVAMDKDGPIDLEGG